MKMKRWNYFFSMRLLLAANNFPHACSSMHITVYVSESNYYIVTVVGNNDSKEIECNTMHYDA